MQMQYQQTKQNFAKFVELAKEVQSRPEKEQWDICLMIQGYLAGRSVKKMEKVMESDSDTKK